MKEHFDLFDTTDQVVVYNPSEDDFKFLVGGEREYEVKAGQFKLLHGSAARLYVKKMCDMEHIRTNRVEDINNKTAEAEVAKLFVKKVIDDDSSLTEKDLAELVKATKKTDEVKSASEEEQPPKEEVQAELRAKADANDIATVLEEEFPELNTPKVAKK